MIEPPTGLASLADFDAFAPALAERIGLDHAGWAPHDRLVERIGWDSLTIMEVLVWSDELGAPLPDHVVAHLDSLGDLHHYLVTIGGHSDSARTEYGPFQGRVVELQPLSNDHLASVTALHTSGDHLSRYRLRGLTPSPEAFQQMLWDRVLVQMVAVADRRVVGLVTALQADLRNRHAHLSVVVSPKAPPGAGAEAAGLLIDHLFRELDLRKLYAEVIEPNLAAFSTGIGRYFEVEGRLRGHEFYRGDYHDLVIIALTKERWATVRPSILGR